MVTALIAGSRSEYASDKKPNFPKQVQETLKQANSLLDDVDQALRNNQYDMVRDRLKEYKALLDAASDDAQAYLESHKKVPRQFKDAEINVRKQLRRMQDIRHNLPIPLRTDLDEAVKTARRLRRKFLGELFVDTQSPKATKPKPQKPKVLP